ncbi:MAG: hypothetical protein FWD75_07210 [Propionibacteriaceae bacterium]|nr:hypothetical protein [Propionibacteriaceae bacterium]
MSLITVIAVCGAIVAAGISVPQFLLVLRTRDTHGLSMTAWVISIGTSAAWLSHGLKNGEINQVWPNVWGVVVAFIILYFLRRNGRFRSWAAVLPGVALGALIIGIDTVVGTVAFGLTIIVPQAYGMIRQGIAVMRARQVTGVSIMAWVFQVSCQGIWAVWGAMTKEAGTFITSAIALVIAVFVLVWRILRELGMGPIGAQDPALVGRAEGAGNQMSRSARTVRANAESS